MVEIRAWMMDQSPQKKCEDSANLKHIHMTRTITHTHTHTHTHDTHAQSHTHKHTHTHTITHTYVWPAPIPALPFLPKSWESVMSFFPQPLASSQQGACLASPAAGDYGRDTHGMAQRASESRLGQRQ